MDGLDMVLGKREWNRINAKLETLKSVNFTRWILLWASILIRQHGGMMKKAQLLQTERFAVSKTYANPQIFQKK